MKRSGLLIFQLPQGGSGCSSIGGCVLWNFTKHAALCVTQVKAKLSFVQAASFQRNWGEPLLGVQKTNVFTAPSVGSDLFLRKIVQFYQKAMFLQV